jgi:hypothetical protein
MARLKLRNDISVMPMDAPEEKHDGEKSGEGHLASQKFKSETIKA